MSLTNEVKFSEVPVGRRFIIEPDGIKLRSWRWEKIIVRGCRKDTQGKNAQSNDDPTKDIHLKEFAPDDLVTLIDGDSDG